MFHLCCLALIIATLHPTIAHPDQTRRQTYGPSTIAITGAAAGLLQARLEIHELLQDADLSNIYFLALQRFQAMDPADPMSYYQIAGIHGQPYQPWDGVQQCEGCNITGYCTHQSTLFPTWHRIYLALFEQQLQAMALEVAKEFIGDDQIRYLDAAFALRMPYWDFGMPPLPGEDAFPQLFTNATVTVNTPEGAAVITNPLLQYDFGTADHSWSMAPNTNFTVRSPDFVDQQPLFASRQQLRKDLWLMLYYGKDYTNFSTDSRVAWWDLYSDPMSLESVHDQVHNDIGGDMMNFPSSAFDPAFWLVHAMVDRVFTLWQAANPDTWLQGWIEPGNTYTYVAGSYQDSQSPLTPFHVNTEGGFWNSDSVRDPTVLNYGYSDIALLAKNSESALDLINSLYGDSDASSAKRSPDTIATASRALSPADADVEYVLGIQVDKMGMAGSFTVYFFDGPEEEDLLAKHGFFTGLDVMGNGSAPVGAGASISTALQSRVQSGVLADMDRMTVGKHLMENIHVSVQLANGTTVSPAVLPRFGVKVVAVHDSVSTSPIWSEVAPEPSIPEI